MDQYELSVPDMACGGCEETVERAVESIEGVERVEADHETGIVSVTTATSADAVRDAIEQSGYDVEA